MTMVRCRRQSLKTLLDARDHKPVEIQKVLMTNDLTLSAAQIVELYDLRWQIERSSRN